MAHKEFLRLMEENVLALDRLTDKLRLDPAQLSGMPRQQVTVLVRLHMGGRARLKDIARREHVSAPNLCATFRKLERDGYVVREIDENDRRNTWYAVTPRGQEVALHAMDNFRVAIGRLFANIQRADEEALTDALKTINKILKNMELNNE